MQNTNAVCRIEKATKKPAIFFYDNSGLQCYTREEQHGTTAIEYYRADTRLPRTFEETAACVMLMTHYEALCAGFDEKIIYRSRLTRRK